MTEAFENALATFKTLIGPVTDNWFITGGACLGFVRNGKFLEHDYDLDIGIMETEEKINEILAVLPVIKKWHYQGKIREVMIRLECQVDIFFLYPFKDQIAEAVFAESVNRVRLYGYPKAILEAGIRQAYINDVEVNILKESEAYCETLYGPAFRIPCTDWNSWLDPHNIIHEDDIIPESHIKSIQPLTATNSENSLQSILQLLADILTKKSLHNLELPVYESCLGSVIFFYHYASLVNESLYKNLADHLLERYNSLMIPEELGNAGGLATYAITINHLVKSGFIEIDRSFFQEIDKCLIVQLDEMVNMDMHTSQIAVCTYIMSRLDHADCSMSTKTYFKNRLCSIFPDIIAHSRLEAIQLLRNVILLKKIAAVADQPFCAGEIEQMQQQLNRLINQLLYQEAHPTHISCYLRNKVPDNAIPFSTGNAEHLVNELQASIRLSVSRNDKHYSASLMAHLNEVLFENDLLKIDPYISFYGTEYAGLNGGLAATALQLASLLDKRAKVCTWDEVLFLS